MKAWPEIVEGLIEKARTGSIQQTKLLLELCDLATMETSNLSEEHKQQLCDALLAGWKWTLPTPEANHADAKPELEGGLSDSRNADGQKGF